MFFFEMWGLYDEPPFEEPEIEYGWCCGYCVDAERSEKDFYEGRVGRKTRCVSCVGIKLQEIAMKPKSFAAVWDLTDGTCDQSQWVSGLGTLMISKVPNVGYVWNVKEVLGKWMYWNGSFDSYETIEAAKLAGLQYCLNELQKFILSDLRDLRAITKDLDRLLVNGINEFRQGEWEDVSIGEFRDE